jgi:hypothetical protein
MSDSECLNNEHYQLSPDNVLLKYIYLYLPAPPPFAGPSNESFAPAAATPRSSKDDGINWY